MPDIAEAERFIHTRLAQTDIGALDEPFAVLETEDLRAIVHRLIIDIGPVKTWTI